MKIAVFGKTGQVATELQGIVSGQHELQVYGRDEVDFSDPEKVAELAASLDVDAVINAVAYTAVDRAEDQTDLADTVNGTSVGALAKACAKSGKPLVHISTDYVFDGRGQNPWETDHQTSPINAYGASKLIGEKMIAALDMKSAVMRTSWVFSVHGNNFVKTMLRLGTERDALAIVADQIGGPTSARSIAKACLKLAESLYAGGPSGVYHFSGGPDVSWADFAREIFAQAGLAIDVKDIPSSDFPTPAKRPGNSRLECSAIKRDHDIDRPDWHADLKDVLQELHAQ